ncbi:hypothetical protein M3Y99_00812800 [Aphelenchoides fujianensis]|nr:hypothetical protein M3Y99_00812800 [Aphelenchoides fujianensis]
MFSPFIPVLVLLAFFTPLAHAARYCLAQGMTIYGTVASTTSAANVRECGYATLEAEGVGFAFDGSSSCQIFSAISGYALKSNGTNDYYVQNDAYTDNTCISQAALIALIHDIVYNGQDCPDTFTYNPTEQTAAECSQYNATWAYPFMTGTNNPCVLYPSFQNAYVDSYYCENYFASLQIFMGQAFCYANVAITATMAADTGTISGDACYNIFDVDTHVLKVGSQTELDWIYTMYGAVSMGAYANC